MSRWDDPMAFLPFAVMVLALAGVIFLITLGIAALAEWLG